MSIKLSSNNVLFYLINLGLCHPEDLVSITIASHNTLLVSLRQGINLVVKQERYYYDDDDNPINFPLADELRFYQVLSSTLDLSYENIHFDLDNSIFVYQYPKNYINLKGCCQNPNNLSIFMAESVGHALALLHRQSLSSEACYRVMNEMNNGKLVYQFPYPIHLQDKLEPERFFTMPPDSYKLIHFFQMSESLNRTVKEVIAQVKYYCLTHNNLDFYNILITENKKNYFSQSEEKNKI